MRKFKVGDDVDYTMYGERLTGIVLGTDFGDTLRSYRVSSPSGGFRWPYTENVRLIEEKKTKTQRIKELEERVAELEATQESQGNKREGHKLADELLTKMYSREVVRISVSEKAYDSLRDAGKLKAGLKDRTFHEVPVSVDLPVGPARYRCVYL